MQRLLLSSNDCRKISGKSIHIIIIHNHFFKIVFDSSVLCMYVCLFVCVSVSVYVSGCVCVFVYLCVSVYVCAYMYVCFVCLFHCTYAAFMVIETVVFV